MKSSFAQALLKAARKQKEAEQRLDDAKESHSTGLQERGDDFSHNNTLQNIGAIDNEKEEGMLDFLSL